MPRGVPRDHGGEMCNKPVTCIHLCTRQDGTLRTIKARDISSHYIVEHGSNYGAYACGVTNCPFSCPKGGGWVSRHIAREHADDDSAYYTYDPTNQAFGPWHENMTCSEYCADESNRALQRLSLIHI